MNAIASLSGSDFQQAMQNLLPPGDALASGNNPLSFLSDLLGALSACMAAAHAQVGVLTETESNPQTTNLLLADWEKSFGLPDPAITAALTVPQRQALLVARIAARGGQSQAFMISFAALLGYTIAIATFKPFVFGGNFGSLIYGGGWAYAWQVNVFGNSTLNFADRSVLMTELTRICPAHTVLIFNFLVAVG